MIMSALDQKENSNKQAGFISSRTKIKIAPVSMMMMVVAILLPGHITYVVP